MTLIIKSLVAFQNLTIKTLKAAFKWSILNLFSQQLIVCLKNFRKNFTFFYQEKFCYEKLQFYDVVWLEDHSKQNSDFNGLINYEQINQRSQLAVITTKQKQTRIENYAKQIYLNQ
ncbi:hypothetical protein ABPG72_021405 [Tetrahymena utriculariae]